MSDRSKHGTLGSDNDPQFQIASAKTSSRPTVSGQQLPNRN